MRARWRARVRTRAKTKIDLYEADLDEAEVDHAI